MMASPNARPRSAPAATGVSARGRGKRAGLAHAEEEAHRDERANPVASPVAAGHGRPEDDDARERLARAEAVGEPAARHLEKGVGEA